MSDFTCRNEGCASPHVRHAARGLCRTCWARFQKAGTLDELYPKAERPVRVDPRRDPYEVYDERYRRWIRNGNRAGFQIDAEQPTQWLRDLRDSMGLRDAGWGDGAIDRVAEKVGITREVANKILSGRSTFLHDRIVERIAAATDNIRAYYALRPAEGRPGWSEHGNWCDGCGTFYHPHHADGLCEECWQHRGDPDFVTRDIRVTREVRAEQMEGFENELATAG